MNKSKTGKTIFLSTPITNAINAKTGYLNTIIATRINMVACYIQSKGFEVFLAIEREKWGMELMSSEKCTPKDFEGLMSSHHLIVLLTDYISEGTLIEIGWASARNIPISIICDKSIELSPLVKGLHTIGNNRIFSFDWSSNNETWKMIINERLQIGKVNK